MGVLLTANFMCLKCGLTETVTGNKEDLKPDRYGCCER
jgi:hypothetical protein